jgi:hypothetical protein
MDPTSPYPTSSSQDSQGWDAQAKEQGQGGELSQDVVLLDRPPEQDISNWCTVGTSRGLLHVLPSARTSGLTVTFLGHYEASIIVSERRDWISPRTEEEAHLCTCITQIYKNQYHTTRRLDRIFLLVPSSISWAQGSSLKARSFHVAHVSITVAFIVRTQK